MGSSRRAWFFFAAAVGVAAVGTAIAYSGGIPPWLGTGNRDKVLHFAMSSILAFFLDSALRGRTVWRGRFAPPLAALVILVPVGIEEYLQRFSAVRSSSLSDFLADALGVAVGCIAARLRARWSSQRAAR